MFRRKNRIAESLARIEARLTAIEVRLSRLERVFADAEEAG